MNEEEGQRMLDWLEKFEKFWDIFNRCAFVDWRGRGSDAYVPSESACCTS
jgi:hypothetical protein